VYPVSLVNVIFGVFQPTSLKIGTCLVHKNFGERHPTSEFDWLDQANWKAA
jgi:hypothetical protein